MASSRNSSNATGLRILWIPGRKRKEHKGRFDATRKNVDYSSKQKPNETWSLGGSKGQRDLLKSDLEPSDGLSSLSTKVLPSASCAAAGAEAAATIKMKTEEENKFAVLAKEDESDTEGGDIKSTVEINNGDTVHSESNNTEAKENKSNSPSSDTCNADTMPISNRKLRNHNNNQMGDVNSIESITEPNDKHLLTDYDSIDGSLHQLSHKGSKKKHKKKKKKSTGNGDGKESDPDELCVNCLFYTCVCCECVIS